MHLLALLVLDTVSAWYLAWRKLIDCTGLAPVGETADDLLAGPYELALQWGERG